MAVIDSVIVSPVALAAVEQWARSSTGRLRVTAQLSATEIIIERMGLTPWLWPSL
jgi:hypothetical protein